MVKQKNKTVLLGMSGGVDSSVAALLLKKKGYNVIGAFMKNFSDNKDPLGQCNWVEERKMAQKIASILEIPFVTLDYEKQYKKSVLEPMFKSYEKGKTPNPDVDCNTKIKFPYLWKEAKKLGADLIATGHYARIKKTRNGYSLLQGKDKTKDQSYFLHELSQSDLEHTLFPIGSYKKEQVRKIAQKNNFPNWNKEGTTGVCFVGPLNFKSFLKNKIKQKKGTVKTPEGEKIGTHPGTSFFTIGEKIGPKKGVIVDRKKEFVGKKLYVVEKKSNSLIVAPEGHPSLKKKHIGIKRFHLLNPNEKIPSKGLKARIRHLGVLLPGKLQKTNNSYSFCLSKPEEGIAEGQSIVLYKKDKLVAGGEISNKSL